MAYWLNSPFLKGLGFRALKAAIEKSVGMYRYVEILGLKIRAQYPKP